MFEISMLQETLMTIFNYLEPTVGTTAQNLCNDCISMQSTNAGSCIFYTTNMNEFTVIEAICSNSTKNANAPYVNFKRLKGLISTIPATEYVTIKENANGAELLLSFSMRKTPIKITTTSGSMLPLPPVMSYVPQSPAEVPIEFLTKVTAKASSIIEDSNIAQLMNCIKLTIGNPNVTAEAIDVNTKRMFFMSDNFGMSPAPETFFLEASKLKKSLKIFEDHTDVEIYSNQSTTVLSGNNRPSLLSRKNKQASSDITSIKYCTRTLNGVYPNVSDYFTAKFLPTEFIILNKEDILNSIARVKALGEKVSIASGIHLKADSSEFEVKFSSPYGDVEDCIKAENAVSTSFAMNFNPTNFEGILRNIPSEYIAVGKMQGGATNFVVKGEGPVGGTPYTGTDLFTILTMANVTP